MSLAARLPAAAVDHCHRLVRLEDKDRYLASLFMPDGRRELVWGLYALNIELARIREQVSSPDLGVLRLQWWRDALGGIFNASVGDHPVLQLLARAIEVGDLPHQPFDGMVSARQFDLFDDPMPSLNDLEGYLGETNSILLQMTASVLTGSAAQSCTEISGLGGVAHGMTGLMRSMPLHRSKGQCFFPSDILAAHGLSPAHILSDREGEGMAAAFSEYLDHAADRLRGARLELKQVPSLARPAYLHLALVDGDIRWLRKHGTRVMREARPTLQLPRQATLWWHNIWHGF